MGHIVLAVLSLMQTNSNYSHTVLQNVTSSTYGDIHSVPKKCIHSHQYRGQAWISSYLQLEYLLLLNVDQNFILTLVRDFHSDKYVVLQYVWFSRDPFMGHICSTYVVGKKYSTGLDSCWYQGSLHTQCPQHSLYMSNCCQRPLGGYSTPQFHSCTSYRE